MITLDQAIARVRTKADRAESLSRAERGTSSSHFGQQLARDAEAMRALIAWIEERR